MNGSAKYSTIATRIEAVRQEVQQTETYSARSSSSTNTTHVQRAAVQHQDSQRKETRTKSVSPRTRLQPLDNAAASAGESSDSSSPRLQNLRKGTERRTSGSSPALLSKNKQAPTNVSNSFTPFLSYIFVPLLTICSHRAHRPQLSLGAMDIPRITHQTYHKLHSMYVKVVEWFLFQAVLSIISFLHDTCLLQEGTLTGTAPGDVSPQSSMRYVC